MSDKPLSSNEVASAHTNTLAHGPNAGKPWHDRANDEIAFGSRREFATRMRQLVETDRERVTTKLATENAAEEFVDAILWGVRQRPPDRTCMNLRSQIMKSIDETQRVVHEFWLKVGAKSETDAAQKIALANSVADADPDSTAEACAAYLEKYKDLKPERMAPIIKRLGGYSPVEQVG